MPKSPIMEYTVSYPMDRLCADILGPLPESERPAKFILCIQDSFSKFVECYCYALPDQRSSTIADKIMFRSCHVMVVVSNCKVINDPIASLSFSERCVIY